MVAAIAGFLAFSLLGSNAAELRSSSGSQSSSDFIIGISPFLQDSVKDEVYRSLVKLVVEDLPLNSTLAIYDAFELKTIARLSVPNAGVFNSPKTRANQFAPAIRDLKLFLARPNVRSTNAPPGFDGRMRLPQFLDWLAESLPSHAEPAVLLIGSPLYQDDKEPAFSMVEGYFPSDGHLQATREKSVFGFNGDTTTVPRLVLHWVYFGDPWVNELHREKVTRFWTLYLERRRTRLAAFTGDLPTAVESFRKAAAGVEAYTRHWAVDGSQTKIEMLRISRGVEIADWLTRDTLSGAAPGPPSILVGPMKIGIRWKDRLDLDLYATPRPDAETLFFEHVRTPEGYYYKDHRSSPGKEYEFIEFESPVDVREVEAFINFYKGHCPGGARGEVRIEFGGRIYGAPFFIPAEQGNLGRAGESHHSYWTPIPIQKLLQIAPRTHRAG